MIGRHGRVNHFEVVRWARQQAVAHGLRTLEAHVLLLLATYANGDGIAWPSIKTLALDCGLKPTRDGRNSAISAALARLEEKQLVWTRQAGHGHTAKRELLFNPEVHEREPSARPEGSGAAPKHPAANQPSGAAEGNGHPHKPQPSGLPEGEPSALADGQPSGLPDQKYQGKSHLEEPTGRARGSLPATRKASHPDLRKAENNSDNESPETVRAAVRASLAHAQSGAASSNGTARPTP